MAAFLMGIIMALITVYDIDGNAHTKEPVDAKECVAVLGWTFESKAKTMPIVDEQKEDIKPIKAKR
jgi:hypothetical protein